MKGLKDARTGDAIGGGKCGIQGASAQDRRSNKELTILQVAEQDGRGSFSEKFELVLYLPSGQRAYN